MRRVWLFGLAALLGLTLSNGRTSFGDDNAAPSQTQTTKKVVAPDAEKTPAKPAARPHLPRFFGKLRLSQEQHDKLVAIGEKYQKQIKELQLKIADLQKQQMAERQAILNEAQKSQLAEIKEKAAKAAADRKAAKAAAKADSDAKPATPQK